MSSIYGKFIIIDSSTTLLDALHYEKNLAERYPYLHKKGWKEGLKLLEKEKDLVRSLFVSASTLVEENIEELKTLKNERPNLALFLIAHRPETLPSWLQKCDAFSKQINRPKRYQDLVDEYHRTQSSENSWHNIAPTPEELMAEIQKDDQHFVPNTLSDYVFTAKSFFNLYVKVGENRYRKILSAGSPVDEKILVPYFEQGVEYVYIPVEEQEKYIRFCEELSSISLVKEAPPKKIKNLLKFGSSISQSLVKTGVTVQKLDKANDLLNQSVSLIKNLKFQDTKMADFISLIETKEHLSFVSFIACMLGMEVGFESTKMVRLVGVSALLHDIGLYALDPKIESEEAIAQDPSYAEVFNQHASYGAKMLRESGVVEELVCQTIENHHFRRFKTSPVNLMSEVIAISDEIHHLLIRENFNQQRVRAFLSKELKNYSAPIELGILKIFKG